MIGRIHQEGKWHFKNIGYFVRVGMHVERRFHHRQDRRDGKAAADEIARQIADDLRAICGKPDFLIGFAKCCPFRRSVFRVDGPSGKGDLAGMFAQRIGAPGKQQRCLRPRSTTGTSTAASRILAVTIACETSGLST